MASNHANELLSLLAGLVASQIALAANEHQGHAMEVPPARGECVSASALPSPGCGQAPSAAFDHQGRLWVAFAQNGHVYVVRSTDFGKSFSPALAVNPLAENLYADGENRPKVAIGPQGQIYVSWTEKSAGKYAGNIRFSHSLDDGQSFSKPLTVNDDLQPITHRFESMAVDAAGNIHLVWIDKRDLEAAKKAGQEYSGAALYTAQSNDQGQSFSANRKLMDHSCECCRIALESPPAGAPIALWRHVYPGNLRDHAIMALDASPAELPPKATDDGWVVDGCPHHGPDMALSGGKAYLAWFTQGVRNKGILFGRYDLSSQSIELQQLIDARPSAARPQILDLGGKGLWLAWKAFNGSATELLVSQSLDQGQSWTAPRVLATTAGNSDHPMLIATQDRAYVSWQTASEGYQLLVVE